MTLTQLTEGFTGTIQECQQTVTKDNKIRQEREHIEIENTFKQTQTRNVKFNQKNNLEITNGKIKKETIQIHAITEARNGTSRVSAKNGTNKLKMTIIRAKGTANS